MNIDDLKEFVQGLVEDYSTMDGDTRTPSQVKQDEILVAMSNEYEAIKKKLGEKKNELATAVNSVNEPASEMKGTNNIIYKSDEFKEYAVFVKNIKRAFELLYDVLYWCCYIDDVDMLEKILGIANKSGLMTEVAEWMGEEDMEELLQIDCERYHREARKETVKMVLEGLIKREEMYA